MQFWTKIPSILKSKLYDMLALTGQYNTWNSADRENVEQILK